MTLKGERSGGDQTSCGQTYGRWRPCRGDIPVGKDRIGRHSETPLSATLIQMRMRCLQEGIRPRTVQIWPRQQQRLVVGSGTRRSPVVKEVHDAEDDGGQAGAEATNDRRWAQTPLQPVDPTTPGQSRGRPSLMHLVELRHFLRQKQRILRASGSHLNSPAWKGS